MSGANPNLSHHDDDHGIGPPGADGVAVKAGHEADRFDVRGILYVPIFVVICCIIAYTVVSTLFSTIVDKKPADRQQADLNDRLARISSTSPRALAGDKDTIVPQPRLEYLKETARESENDIPFIRSKRGLDTPSNTYEIRPEDLRPENYVDPITKKRMLAEAAYADDEKKFIRVPVNDVIKMFAEKKVLPVSTTPVTVKATTDENAKLSNGGRSAAKLLEQPKPQEAKK